MRHRTKGFSLIEMAMVMVLMGLLLGGLVVPVSQGMEQTKRSDAARQLQQIREALLGFAAARGRLPCPVDEGGVLPGYCASPPANHGFVSARELGLDGPVDEAGRLLDPWGHPFRYSVTVSDGGAFTAADPARQMRAVGMATLTPRLFVCGAAAGCSWAGAKVKSVPALFYSTGRNGSVTSSPQELENLDDDDAFVERAFSELPGAEFDDIVAWISPNVLYAKLIAAGQLP